MWLAAGCRDGMEGSDFRPFCPLPLRNQEISSELDLISTYMPIKTIRTGWKIADLSVICNFAETATGNGAEKRGQGSVAEREGPVIRVCPVGAEQRPSREKHEGVSRILFSFMVYCTLRGKFCLFIKFAIWGSCGGVSLGRTLGIWFIYSH